MIVNVKARYADGVLTPLEPLDLDEGKEVMVSIEDTEAAVKDTPPAGQGLASLAARVAELRESVPPETWDGLPTDLAKNKKHYLYGHPKEEEE
ncbi:MAG: antitoxin family protein [Chloroflexi bacterium]|nr:antitoxin family protein [Chloroflexota bacterium]